MARDTVHPAGVAGATDIGKGGTGSNPVPDVAGRRIGVLGVPSSAGAHWPGQERAPAALRDAGLLEILRETGANVVDHGDLPRVRSRPERRCSQNIPSALGVVESVTAAVDEVARAGGWPLVIGGDCTITLGVLAGLRRSVAPATALLYLDGGPDLRTPANQPDCRLDAMGVAHMLAMDGAAPELIATAPPLDPTEIVFLGGRFDPVERRTTDHLGLRDIRRAAVAADPRAAARDALIALPERPFLVHFDVDVIDFVDLPLADVPQINTGLSLDHAVDALGEALHDPRCAGLVVTEVNPDHGDEDGADLLRLVRALARSLSPTDVPPSPDGSRAEPAPVYTDARRWPKPWP